MRADDDERDGIFGRTRCGAPASCSAPGGASIHGRLLRAAAHPCAPIPDVLSADKATYFGRLTHAIARCKSIDLHRCASSHCRRSLVPDSIVMRARATHGGRRRNGNENDQIKLSRLPSRRVEWWVGFFTLRLAPQDKKPPGCRLMKSDRHARVLIPLALRS